MPSSELLKVRRLKNRLPGPREAEEQVQDDRGRLQARRDAHRGEKVAQVGAAVEVCRVAVLFARRPGADRSVVSLAHWFLRCKI